MRRGSVLDARTGAARDRYRTHAVTKRRPLPLPCEDECRSRPADGDAPAPRQKQARCRAEARRVHGTSCGTRTQLPAHSCARPEAGARFSGVTGAQSRPREPRRRSLWQPWNALGARRTSKARRGRATTFGFFHPPLHGPTEPFGASIHRASSRPSSQRSSAHIDPHSSYSITAGPSSRCKRSWKQ